MQETLRDMMGLMIRGTIAHSLQNIERYGIKTLADVRNSPEVILLPDGLAQQHAQLKSQMYKKLYHHQEVSLVRKDVEQVIGGLFQVYMENPHLLPAGPAGETRVQPNDTDTQKARVVCDYVAGLTDAQAYQQVKRFEPLLSAQRTLALF